MMKMTEKQLAQLFQTTHNDHLSTSDASDILSANDASSARLDHIEDLLDDQSTAQALKLSLSLKEFSNRLAQDIENTKLNKKTWFNFFKISTPMKASFAALSLALVVILTQPNLQQINDEVIHGADIIFVASEDSTKNTNNDIIKTIRFENGSDHLSSGGFDKHQNGSSDNLFNAGFS